MTDIIINWALAVIAVCIAAVFVVGTVALFCSVLSEK